MTSSKRRALPTSFKKKYYQLSLTPFLLDYMLLLVCWKIIVHILILVCLFCPLFELLMSLPFPCKGLCVGWKGLHPYQIQNSSSLKCCQENVCQVLGFFHWVDFCTSFFWWRKRVNEASKILCLALISFHNNERVPIA